MGYTKPYFDDVANVGDLYMKYILLYYDCPQVFICRGPKEELYFCVLVEPVIAQQQWLLAPTDLDRIKAMFDKKITVHDMLSTAEGDGFIITYKQGIETQITLPCVEFKEDDLPMAGYYWESDEGDLVHCLDALAE